MAFRKDFLWGGATAANQYEGGVFEGGATMATGDIMTNGSHTVKRQVTWKMEDGTIGSTPLCFGSDERHLPQGAVPTYIDDPKYYYPSHKASDGYHFFKDDIALMAEMGFRSYRFSTKWSRIYPDPYGEPSEEGLAYYEAVVDECLKYGIEPLITLHHYETPLIFAQTVNGWADRSLVEPFVKYCETLMERLEGKCRYYLTFNEINHIDTAPYVTAGLIHADEQDIANGAYHQFLASAMITKVAHERFPGLQIGMMLGFSPSYGYTADPNDQLLAMQSMDARLFYADVQMTGKYPAYKLIEYKNKGITLPIHDGDMDIIGTHTCDFLSFSCYGSHVYTVHTEMEGVTAGYGNGAVGTVRNPYLKTNAWGWATDPQCLRIVLKVFTNRYHCPLWCVENGIGWNDVYEDGTVHDDYRIEYMRANIQSMKDAVEQDGVDLMGYLYWGSIDIVSNGEGEMAKRYGQVYVDADNLGNGSFKRSRKDSFHWYKKVIASNGEDLA